MKRMIFREIKWKEPLELFARLIAGNRDAFLLESAEGPEHASRFSFAGAAPVEKVVSLGNYIECSGRRKERIDSFLRKQSLRKRGASKLPFPYVGGYVGYFSYDIIRQFERLPDTHPPSGFPDAELGLFEDGFIFDHFAGKAYYFSWSDDREKELLSSEAEEQELQCSRFTSSPSREEFIDMVNKAKQYIIDGDIFQVVLSRRIRLGEVRGLLPFYASLRKINPSPYMYFVNFGERTVIGSSPETLVRVSGRKVITYPIAGTRPVTGDRKKDALLRMELLSDEKERAEHNMLVDLARNDIGRVSKFGTVRVPEYMKVDRYSHVQHIVSSVEGTLSKERDALDALFSIFPAGTVSGAPKIRAMEIIEELEPFRRGPYAGAVGYYSFNGSLDSAIAIRTLFRNGQDAFLQAGCGIVYDSRPQMEFEETENKLKALMTAFGGLK